MSSKRTVRSPSTARVCQDEVKIDERSPLSCAAQIAAFISISKMWTEGRPSMIFWTTPSALRF